MVTATRTTRDLIMDTAELIFAEEGVDAAATREIVETAGQRNASALTYHFGSRENLLLAILARRGAPIDAGRGGMRARLGPRPDTAELMACLAVPYAAQLDSPGGRAYLRIVAQLRGRFAGWRVDSDEATTANLARILDELEAHVAGPPEIRDARMLGMIMLLTGIVAERAQCIDRRSSPDLDDGAFVDNLVAMCTAVIDR